MVENVIEYNGKKYPIKEPTIKTWSEIMKLKDVMDEGELYIRVIELTTGLTREQILESEASKIKEIGEKVFVIVNGSNKKVAYNFEFNGQEYEFLDLNNLSFGQYIDIDTFLSKSESYRIQNLSELAAYLYREKGTKYGEKNIQDRIKKFEDLPVKYLEGSVFFLLNTARASVELTQIYSKSKFLRLTMKTKIIFHLIGAGIKQSAHLVKTRFGYLGMLLTYPLLSVLIISRTLWTLIRSKKRK
jgi:hypothetical protein